MCFKFIKKLKVNKQNHAITFWIPLGSISVQPGYNEEDAAHGPLWSALGQVCSLQQRMKVKVKSLSRAQLFATPQTIAQDPPSMGFPGKCTRVVCHFLLQGILPTQGSNLGLLNCRQTLYYLSQPRLDDNKNEVLNYLQQLEHGINLDVYCQMNG